MMLGLHIADPSEYTQKFRYPPIRAPPVYPAMSHSLYTAVIPYITLNMGISYNTEQIVTFVIVIFAPCLPEILSLPI